MIPIATIQEQLKGLFPDVLDFHFMEATPERVTARLTVRPELCTVGEVMHGGAGGSDRTEPGTRRAHDHN